MGILRTDRITGLGGANAIKGSVLFSEKQYFIIDNQEDFQFGTGDWTIEYWWNGVQQSSGGYNSVITTLVSSNESGTWRVGHTFNGNNQIYFARGTGSSFTDVTFDVNVNDNKWHHIAFVRSSGTIIPFVDGVDRTADKTNGSVSDGNNMTTTNRVIIGFNSRDNDYLQGHVSNLRVIKGTALYTSNFTPPTGELQKLSGTSLLCFQSPSNILKEETGKILQPYRDGSTAGDQAGLNSTYAVATRFTPNSPVGFSTTTDVGSQYGTTFDGFGSFATSTYMFPPGGNTRERNRGRGVFGGGFNGVSPNVTNTISYVEVQSGGIFKDFGDLTLARGYSPAGQTSSSTRGIFAGGYGGGGGYNTIDFITIANTGNAIDFGDISVAKFGQGGLSNQTRALFGGNQTAPFDNIIEFVTIATTGNAQDFGDLVKQRGLTAGASSSTRGVFTGGRSNTPSSNAQDNIMEYVTIATTGNTQDFGDLSTTTRYGHTGFSSPTRGISAGGFDPSGQAKTIDYFTIATLGNSSDFGDLSAVTGYCGSVTNSTRGAVTINNQPNYYNTLEFITIATLGDAQDFGDADVGSSKGHGDFPACASDSHGGVA